MDKTIYTREYAEVLRLLRELRHQAGLTQVEMAQKLHLTQSLFSKMERGDRRLDIVELRTICVILGVSLSDFVDRFERGLAARARSHRRKRG